MIRKDYLLASLKLITEASQKLNEANNIMIDNNEGIISDAIISISAETIILLGKLEIIINYEN